MGHKNYKIIRRKNEHYILLKSEKGQYLNLSDVEYIDSHAVNGLLITNIGQKKNSFFIRYNITGLCSMKEYLRTTTLNKYMFGQMLSYILQALREIGNQLDKEKLVTDLRYVMVNAATRQVQFMYLPVQYWEGRSDFRGFFENLVYAEKTKFARNEDTSYVMEFLQIVKRGVGLSLVDLEEFVTRLDGNSDKKEQKQCKFCTRKFPIYQKYCSICGNLLDESTSQQSWKMWHNTMVQNEERTYKRTQPEKIVLDGQLGTMELEMGTVSFERYEEKENEGEESEFQVQEPRVKREIICIRTNVRCTMEKDEVCIGRSAQADVRTDEENLRIGRMHAYLKKEDGKIFIKDNRSNNGTFVENVLVGSKKKPNDDWIPLPSSGEFRLANEEFVYKEIL